jgi:hypothetical protein
MCRVSRSGFQAVHACIALQQLVVAPNSRFECLSMYLMGGHAERSCHQHARASLGRMQQCLRQHPVAIEAATALADLGVPYDAIVDICPLMACDHLCTRPPQAALHELPSDALATNAAAPPLHLAPCTTASLQQPVLGDDDSTLLPPAAALERPRPEKLCSAGTESRATLVATSPSKLCDSPPSHAHRSTAARMAGEPRVAASCVSAGADALDNPARLIARVSMCAHAGNGERSFQRQRNPMAATVLASVDAVDAHEQRLATERIGEKSLQSSCGVEALAGAASDRVGGMGRLSKRRKVSAPRSALDCSAPQLPQNCRSDNVLSFVLATSEAQPQVRVARKRSLPTPGLLDIAHSGDGTGRTPFQRGGCQAQGNSSTGIVSAEAGTPQDDVDTCRLVDCEPSACHQQHGFGWLGLLVQGHAHMFSAAASDACASFNALADLFPNELVSVLSAAQALLAAGEHVAACSTFQRARLLDPLNVQAMDAYASLLLEQGCRNELRQLSHDMTNIDLALPEVWAVMACFWQSKGNWDKAMEFVDRCDLGSFRLC